MKTAVIIAGLFVLFGIVGTPDYVLDIERENEQLRAKLFKERAATLACSDLRKPTNYAEVSE